SHQPFSPFLFATRRCTALHADLSHQRLSAIARRPGCRNRIHSLGRSLRWLRGRVIQFHFLGADLARARIAPEVGHGRGEREYHIDPAAQPRTYKHDDARQRALISLIHHEQALSKLHVPLHAHRSAMNVHGVREALLIKWVAFGRVAIHEEWDRKRTARRAPALRPYRST